MVSSSNRQSDPSELTASRGCGLTPQENCPVDISKVGITLINNLVGLLPVGIAAYAKGEIQKLPFRGGVQRNAWEWC